VNFGPVTSELTELFCERLVRHGQKTGIFCRISQDIYTIPIFETLSPYESALGADDRLYPFRFDKELPLPLQPSNIE